MIEIDKIFLSRAFELASFGRFTTTPNPNVGCVIVNNKCIVGEGYHKFAGQSHAEIYALQQAGKKAYGATAYITLEPCDHYGYTPPCTDALIRAGISRVVFSVKDPNPKISGSGLYRLQQAGITVNYNCMIKKAEEINKGFFKRMRTGFPWVILKLASSLDGRTSMFSGESKWITSLQSRQDVQSLRAESDVILSTASTIVMDNPNLTVRWLDLPNEIKSFYYQQDLRQPVRIIIDGHNRVTPFYRIIQQKGKITWLVRIVLDNLVWPNTVSQLVFPKVKNQYDNYYVNLIILLAYLGEKNINIVLVESGAYFSGILLNYKLVDELILYQSPKLLGNMSRPLCILYNLTKINYAIDFILSDIKLCGPDVRMSFKHKKHNI